MKKKKLKEEWAKKREIEEMKEVRDRPETNYKTSQQSALATQNYFEIEKKIVKNSKNETQSYTVKTYVNLARKKSA